MREEKDQNDNSNDRAKRTWDSDSKKKWTRTKNQPVYSCKGKTDGMNGNVFQVNGEQRKKGQFRDTLDKLQVYSAQHHKEHSRLLAVLFEDLTTLQVSKPV